MKKLTLLISDLVVLYGTLMLVVLMRYGLARWSIQFNLHVTPFSILFGVWLFSFYIANLYEERVLRNGRDFIERLAQAITIAAALSIVFFYLIPFFGITPKTNLFLFIVIVSALQIGTRSLFNHLLAGGSKKRVLVIGVNDESLDLARFVTENPQFGYTVSALVQLGQEMLPMEDVRRWRIIDDLDGIENFIRANHIDMVVMSPRAYDSDRIIEALYRIMSEQVNFATLSGFTERLTGMVPLGAISQSWFLDNMAEGSKKSYEGLKRGMDVVGAILLGVPTVALTPFVILAIWASSPGYPFLHQQRTGRGGKPFMLMKFRSMIPDAEKTTGVVWAGEHDPRITRTGRFLRKTRIDELPQLWNILRGDMSFVGPRAERPEFDEKLAPQVPFYRERYLIKPGLSGWAQINYPYVASVTDAVKRVEYDLYYIKHRSLVLDLEIILKTISISLRQAGR